MAGNKIMDILNQAVPTDVSDVHLSVGMRPRFREHSRLTDTEHAEVTESAMEGYIKEIVPPEKMETLLKTRELDFSFGTPETARFRVNVYFEQGNMGIAVRILRSKVWSFEELGYPQPLMESLANAHSGLVLVTGNTGSGKSTTLASMIDFINKTRDCHIVTIEDPVEFIFKHQRATVHQREMGADTLSFTAALKHVLRQDPDVILIGEMRDLETIEAALTVAETGHLVFGTLHTSDAVSTINRIVDVFPAYKQQQVRAQMAFILNGVISQRLIPCTDGKGRALAAEIMLANSGIRSMIRDAKDHQIYSMIQTGVKEGMKTMNQSLADLCRAKKIDVKEASRHTSSPADLYRLVGVPSPAMVA